MECRCPFILGQILRPYVYPYMLKLPGIVKAFDQSTILMVVYGAFSGAVVAGLWEMVSWETLLILTLACSVFLTLIMLLALYIPKWMGFNRQDQIAMFFCSSKKTLASGVPMAQIFIYRPAFRHDCFAYYDLSSNSANGVRRDCQLLVEASCR